MRADKPRKAVCSVTLTGGTTPIDIKVYKRCDDMRGVGIQRHYYHSVCNTQVNRVNVCPTCEMAVSSEEIAAFMPIGDALYEFSNEDIRDEWGCAGEAKVMHYPSSDDFTKAVIGGTIYLRDPYLVAPSGPVDEVYLARMLAAMREANQVALMNIPIQNQMRRAVLFPNKTLYTLYFEEEIRNDIPEIIPSRKVKTEEVAGIVEWIKKRRKGIGRVPAKVTPEKVMARFLSD